MNNERPSWYSFHRALAWISQLFLVIALVGCAEDDRSRPVGTVEQILELKERDDINVLFILVDTLRADRLSCYGHDRKTSPVLDLMAGSGILFKNHLAQSSWTKCSMASMWTGLYPNRSGVLRSRDAVPEGALMPAEILNEAGFRTAGIFRNGWLKQNFGFAQGFEIYMMPNPSNAARESQRNDPAAVAGTDNDAILTATGFLRTHESDRWFLYVHLLDVHQYVSDEDTSVFGTSYSDIYDNSILWTDKLIGYLLSELGGLGLMDRTLVVLASDHGEAFGEHGKDGHAYDVYGEVTEVPWLISLPFGLNPGIVVDAPTENVDIWPTILDLLGLPPLPDTDGTSQVPQILAAAHDAEPPEFQKTTFAQLDQTWGKLDGEENPIVSVTDGAWRLFYTDHGETLELFNKEQDPTEQRSVAESRSDIVEELKTVASDYLERQDRPWGESANEVEINEMELQQLRALGYGIQ